MTPAAGGQPSRSGIRRILIASTIGTAIEWYDLFLYSAASALVIAPLFFPPEAPVAGQVEAFATFTAGFLARPLGGILFGHLGDRAGRRVALVVTMMIMGAATFCVGLLPTYQQIGLWAPVLLVLLRLFQGLGIGGEWGGAVLFATENAPPHKKGFYSSWPASGFPIGLLASTFAFSVIPYEAAGGAVTWHWRIPFLSSVLLIVVGTFVRLKISETAQFTEFRKTGDIVRVPVFDAMRGRGREVLTGALAALGTGMVVTTFSVYYVSRASLGGAEARSAALIGLMIGAGVEALAIPLFGALSDRLGRRRVIIFGFALTGLAAVPAGEWLTSGDVLKATAVFVLALGIGHAAIYGSLAGLLVELFPIQSRYSGMAITYGVGSTIASFAPLMAAVLVGGGADMSPVTVMFLAVIAVAATAVACTPRRPVGR